MLRPLISRRPGKLTCAALAVLSPLATVMGCKKATEPDQEPPTVSLVRPADGDTVRGTVSVTASLATTKGWSKSIS